MNASESKLCSDWFGKKKHEFKIAKFHFLSEFHNGILLYTDQFFHNDYPDFYGFEVKFGFGFWR